ncbi:MAG: hypothetical protein ABEJ22_05640 [Haloferacaceae archaeon]
MPASGIPAAALQVTPLVERLWPGPRATLAFGLGLVAGFGAAYVLVGSPYSQTARKWTDVARRAERRESLAVFACLLSVFGLLSFGVAAGGWSSAAWSAPGPVTVLWSALLWGFFPLAVLLAALRSLSDRWTTDGDRAFRTTTGPDRSWTVVPALLFAYVVSGFAIGVILTRQPDAFGGVLPEIAAIPAPTRTLTVALAPGLVAAVAFALLLGGAIVAVEPDAKRVQRSRRTAYRETASTVGSVLGPPALALGGLALVVRYPYPVLAAAVGPFVPSAFRGYVWTALAGTGVHLTVLGGVATLSFLGALRELDAEVLLWSGIKYGLAFGSTAAVVWPGFVRFDAVHHGQFFASAAVIGLGLGVPLRYLWVREQERSLASELVERTRDRVESSETDGLEWVSRDADRAVLDVRSEPTSAIRTARRAWNAVALLSALEVATDHLDDISDLVATVPYVDHEPFRALRDEAAEIRPERSRGATESSVKRARSIGRRLRRRRRVAARRVVVYAALDLVEWGDSPSALPDALPPRFDHEGVEILAYDEPSRSGKARVLEVRSRRSDPVTVTLRDRVDSRPSDLPDACEYDPESGVRCSLRLDAGERRVLGYGISSTEEVDSERITATAGGSSGEVRLWLYTDSDLAEAMDRLGDREGQSDDDASAHVLTAVNEVRSWRYRSAFEEVREAYLATEPPVDELLSDAKRNAETAADAFDAGDYDAAVDRWTDARERYEQVEMAARAQGDADLASNAAASVERVTSNVADTRRQRANDRVVELATEANDRVERAERAFEEGQYSRAAEDFREARDTYREAASLADEYDLDDHERLAEAAVRADERVIDCALGKLRSLLDRAERRVEEDPGDADASFESILEHLTNLRVDREDVEALADRAQEGHLRAKVERARDGMEEAEQCYDDGRLDEAKREFLDVEELLEEASERAEAYDEPAFEREIAELADTCAENVDRVNAELASVDDVEASLERVGEVPTFGDDDRERA